MNPLLINSSSMPQRQQPPDLMQFIKSTNPQQAKQRVEQMLRSGQITQGQCSQAFEEAKQIMSSLGLK